jgi:hypothetical protein
MTDKIITINKPEDFQKVKKSIESWIDANVDFYVYAWICSKEIIDGEKFASGEGIFYFVNKKVKNDMIKIIKDRISIIEKLFYCPCPSKTTIIIKISNNGNKITIKAIHNNAVSKVILKKKVL